MGPLRQVVGNHTKADLCDIHNSDRAPARDPLYLFACLLAWRQEGDVTAYQELVAALDDGDPHVREAAEHFLHRPWPRIAGKKKEPIRTSG